MDDDSDLHEVSTRWLGSGRSPAPGIGAKIGNQCRPF
jgi:hypothetical protein